MPEPRISDEAILMPWEQGYTLRSENDEPTDDSVEEQDTVDESTQDDEREIENELDDDPESTSERDEVDTDEEEEDTDDPVYAVRVNGEDLEVPLSELLSGYSRTADYTRKTQEIARQRDETAAELSSLREARTKYSAQLDQLHAVLKEALPKEPDPALERSDPQRHSIEYTRYERSLRKLELIEQEQERVRGEEQQEWDRQYRQIAANEHSKLLAAVPAWKDTQKATAELQKMVEFARNQYGFTDAELATLIDHRLVLGLRDAMRFHALSPDRNRKTGKRLPKPPLRPGSVKGRGKGSKRDSRVRAAEKQLARTGSMKDAVAAFYARLEAREE